MPRQFPEGFLWGASTSAHQVEGGLVNDWSEWEKGHADQWAMEALRDFPQLTGDLRAAAMNPDNYISGSAAEAYTRYEADFDLAQSLGHTAYRFSLDWSRIEPEQGQFNQQAIDHYHLMIQSLKRRGIEPFVTLWHWPLPLWLRDQGGWESPQAIFYFDRFCQTVAKAYHKDVKFFLTLNEPEIYVSNSYLSGKWPPGEKSYVSYWRVFHRLIAAHRRVYKTLKAINPDFQIGIAKNNIYFEVATNNWLDQIRGAFINWWWNDYFLDKIQDAQDFIGLNHYFHNRIDHGFGKNKNKRVSDLGWELYPEAVYHVLLGLRSYNKPIYITENGLADAADSQRAWFIRHTLMWVHKAIMADAPVKGYLHWSLLDNFEWDKGFWPRFGLIAVDYATQKRTIRPSAKVYAEIIRANAIAIDERDA